MKSNPDINTSIRPWLWGAAIILITAAVYVPAMRSGFVWDDDMHLIDNIVLKENGLYNAWFSDKAFVYYPIVWTTYWIEHHLWGLDPTGYHVVNVLLHAISAVLTWRVLLRLGIPGAWLAALVFALHPVNVESVAWITQYKNTLCMVFYLAAVLTYLRYEDEDRWSSYLLAVCFFALSMLSKGASVPLPAVLLLAAWWRRGWIEAADVVRTIPFWVVAAVMSVVEVTFQSENVIVVDVVRDDSLLAHVAGAGWVTWSYLSKAVWPAHLSFVYRRWQIDEFSMWSYVPNLMLVLLLALFWWRRKSWGRPLFAALAYFVLTITPAMGFVYFYYLKYSYVADHYQYFSIIGVIALFVALGTRLAITYRRTMAPWLRVAAVLLVITLSVTSWRQASAYEDANTLWRDTLGKSPDAWMGHYNLAKSLTVLGNDLRKEGHEMAARRQHAQAVIHYRQAVRANPRFDKAYNNLGEALLAQDKQAEAIKCYQTAIELKPDFAVAHYNLANVLQEQRKFEQAIYHYRQAIESHSEYAQAHNNLGNALRSVGKLDDAAYHYRKALQIDPDHVLAHYNLAIVLIGQGDHEEGLSHLRRAGELNPDLARRHIQLAQVLGRQGRLDKSIEHWRYAAWLVPGDAKVHYQLAQALSATGQSAEAARHLQQAVKLAPNEPMPLNDLAWLWATHGDDVLYRPAEALPLAQRAAKLTGHNNPAILDTLAAAQAATQRFDEAVKTAQRATTLAQQAGLQTLADQVRQRLQGYQQGQPYRAPAAGP